MQNYNLIGHDKGPGIAATVVAPDCFQLTALSCFLLLFRLLALCDNLSEMLFGL
jgi:hypothetical protein